jgi:ribonuclease BN (tRNA processing enzyme)
MMMLELRVLGVCAAYPAFEDACSGYLISDGDILILLDCGPGIMAKLPGYVSYFDLTAIVITHLHTDHYLDLFPLRYALTYSFSRPEHYKKIPLIMPPGDYDQLFPLMTKDREKFDELFLPIPISEQQILTFGDLKLEFRAANHPIQTFACRISDQFNRTFVYTSDTGWSDDLTDFANSAELILCEATMQDQHQDLTKSGHMTARQAGTLAARSGAKRLMLTHIWPEYDREISRREAFESWGQPVEVAMTGHSIVI